MVKAPITIEDIQLGDDILLFDETGKYMIGGATNNSLTFSPEYFEISCKEAGLFGWRKLKKLNWEITTENLFIFDNFKYLFTNMKDDLEFTVYFGMKDKASSEFIKVDDAVFEGKVKVTSLSLNAPSGDNATYSATFTGGPIELGTK